METMMDWAEADAKVKEQFLELLEKLRNGESVQLPGEFSDNASANTLADNLAVEVDNVIHDLKKEWGWE